MQRYFSILTEIGKAQLANAIAMGRKLNVTALKIGDGGEDEGKETFPKEDDTNLKRVKATIPVNMIYGNEDNPHWVVFDSVLPDDVGGFYITELGLYDDDDNLIAIGKYPKTYKAKRGDGISTSIDLEVICQIGNVEHVELKIDPAKVLATVNYVDKQFNDHEQAVNPHPQYLQKTELEAEVKDFMPNVFEKAGYQQLPGGLLIQWGETVTYGHTPDDDRGLFQADFAIPFKQQVFASFANVFLDNNTAIIRSVSLTSISGTSVDAATNFNTNNGTKVCFVAIGY